MILTMEDNDCFDLGGLHLQSGSCGVADMSANSSGFFDRVEEQAVTTKNILVLKKKLLSMQSVHREYQDKCNENDMLRTDLENVKKQLVTQCRASTILKKQVQMVVNGGHMKIMETLKKEKEMKVNECAEAQRSLVVLQGLLAQMKAALQDTERSRDTVCAKIELQNEMVSALKSKNEVFEKRFALVLQGREAARSEKKEKTAAVKRTAVLERQLEKCKVERDILADELARSQSHMGLAQEQLEKAHAEIEHMRSSMEEMRHQLITGTVLNRSLTSEVCRSPASIETSPNLVLANVGPEPHRPVSLEPDVEEGGEDEDTKHLLNLASSTGKEDHIRPSQSHRSAPPASPSTSKSLSCSSTSTAFSTTATATTSTATMTRDSRSKCKAAALPAVKARTKAGTGLRERRKCALPASSVSWCPTRSATTPNMAFKNRQQESSPNRSRDMSPDPVSLPCAPSPVKSSFPDITSPPERALCSSPSSSSSSDSDSDDVFSSMPAPSPVISPVIGMTSLPDLSSSSDSDDNEKEPVPPLTSSPIKSLPSRAGLLCDLSCSESDSDQDVEDPVSAAPVLSPIKSSCAGISSLLDLSSSSDSDDGEDEEDGTNPPEVSRHEPSPLKRPRDFFPDPSGDSNSDAECSRADLGLVIDADLSVASVEQVQGMSALPSESTCQPSSPVSSPPRKRLLSSHSEEVSLVFAQWHTLQQELRRPVSGLIADVKRNVRTRRSKVSK